MLAEQTTVYFINFQWQEYCEKLAECIAHCAELRSQNDIEREMREDWRRSAENKIFDMKLKLRKLNDDETNEYAYGEISRLLAKSEKVETEFHQRVADTLSTVDDENEFKNAISDVLRKYKKIYDDALTAAGYAKPFDRGSRGLWS